jgi:hypothetical protein
MRKLKQEFKLSKEANMSSKNIGVIHKVLEK